MVVDEEVAEWIDRDLRNMSRPLSVGLRGKIKASFEEYCKQNPESLLGLEKSESEMKRAKLLESLFTPILRHYHPTTQIAYSPTVDELVKKVVDAEDTNKYLASMGLPILMTIDVTDDEHCIWDYVEPARLCDVLNVIADIESETLFIVSTPDVQTFRFWLVDHRKGGFPGYGSSEFRIPGLQHGYLAEEAWNFLEIFHGLFHFQVERINLKAETPRLPLCHEYWFEKDEALFVDIVFKNLSKETRDRVKKAARYAPFTTVALNVHELSEDIEEQKVLAEALSKTLMRKRRIIDTEE